MRFLVVGFVAALSSFVAWSPSGQDSKVSAPEGVEALAWLAGTWEGSMGKVDVEEVWMAPKGGAMIGMHRDVAGSKMVGFEYLRIVTKNGKLTYVASPQGGLPTSFPLKEMTEKKVVFENPEHDFPQRIIYWLEKDGALHAKIEGDQGGKPAEMEWTWRRPGEAKAK